MNVSAKTFKILFIQAGIMADTTPLLNHLLIFTLIYDVLGYVTNPALYNLTHLPFLVNLFKPYKKVNQDNSLLSNILIVTPK